MTEAASEAGAQAESPEDKKAAAKLAKAEKAATEKAAKAAQKEAAKKEAAATALAAKQVEKDTQNGVPRPGSGLTLLVWQTADKLSSELERPVERSELTKALEGKVQTGTIHTQYGRWRKYNGLVESKDERRARLEADKTAKAEKAAAEKQAKADKKAADKAEKDAVAAQKAAAAAKKGSTEPVATAEAEQETAAEGSEAAQ